MSRLAETLSDVVAELDSRGRRFALLGGIAVSARAEPRFTRDLDFAVLVRDDQDAEVLIRDLAAAGFRVVMQVEQELVQRLATVRLIPPQEDDPGIVVDLLFASSGVESEVIDGAETLEVFPKVRVPVACRAHLLALKVLAHDERTRPMDGADILALGRGARIGEFAEVERLLTLIAQRHFNRGRDLLSLWTEWKSRIASLS
jgi:hypothetical protein